jgi:hypothetical protein
MSQMSQIIDSDGHIVEPRSVWEEYTEPAFREKMIQIRRNRDGVDELWIDGENAAAPHCRSRPPWCPAASRISNARAS